MVVAQISGSCSKSTRRMYVHVQKREREGERSGKRVALVGWLGGWLVGRSGG